MIIGATSEAEALFLLSPDRAQPPADEAIHETEHGWRGVLEVVEPSPKHRVEIADDPLHAVAAAPFRLGAHFVLERFQALLAHEPMPAFEAVAEEIKSLTPFTAVADPRLVRM